MIQKLIVITLLLGTMLYAQETCYTVELISAVKNQKNRLSLEKNNYEKSCKVMEIGNMLSIRCGCFEKYKDAKKYLTDFKSEYKDAYVRTTYKSRFKTKKIKVSQPAKTVEHNIIKQQIEKVIVPTQTIIEPTHTNEITTKSHKENSASQVRRTTTIVKVQKTKKNKKKKRAKYVKKREASFNYQKYLRYLSNKRPIRPFGYLYSFGGQISYDFGYVDQTPAEYSNFPQPYFNRIWRRIRVDHTGSFFDKKLFYEFEYSFTGSDNYKDVYIGYQDKILSDSFYRIKMGNIKIPYSLQRYTSSKNLSFMERPLGDDAFSIGRKLGLEIFLHTKLEQHLFGLFLASYTNSIDERKHNEPNRPGNSIRVTYTYKFSKRHLLHIGIAFLTEDLKNNQLHYKQGSESKIMNEKYVSTKIESVDNRNLQNLDIMYLNNKYYFEAAYMDSTVAAQKGDYHFYSYFLQGSYFFIGRGKRFNTKESKFSKIKTTKGGALELALRYSYINLNDKNEQGGEQTNYNFSLNWYLTTEFKVMMNYIRALPEGTDDYNGVLNIYQMRLLFAF